MSYYLKKHWKINLLVSMLLILVSGLMVYLNLILIQVFQSIIERDLHGFIFWTVANMLLWLSALAIDGVLSWAQSRAIYSMNNQLRSDIVASLVQRNFQEFHSQQSGEYLSWFINDINQIETNAWNSFYSIISTSSKVIFSLVALTKLHWSLLAISLLTAIVIINTPTVFGKKIENLSTDVAQQQAKGTSRLKELLAGFDVLRFFGHLDHFISGNHDASEMIEKSKHKLNCTQAFIGEGINLVNVVCQVVVNALVGILSIKGIIVQAALMGCGNLCGGIYNGLASLGQLRLAIMSSKPYFDKITTYAETTPANKLMSTNLVQESITVDGVGFCYDEKPILENLSLHFNKGGKYALIGPSGCGKSTLLKLLLGWLPDYTGSIQLDGKDAKSFTSEQLQQQMSYIEQDVFLFNTTIRENITLGEAFSEDQLTKALRDSALVGDLATMPLGLDTPVGEEGSCLSGGQKQRVAIARALIHNRSILLVDEGTSALDQKNADIVEKSLLSNPDLTLILVSHHLSPERKVQFDEVFELEPVRVAI